MIKFSLATLYVENMDKAITFYNEILEIPILRRQSAGPSGELVFLGVEGEPNLELVPANEKVDHAGFSIGFQVTDLQMIKDRLKKNGYEIHREFSPDGSTTLCFLTGPNGEEVELVHYK